MHLLVNWSAEISFLLRFTALIISLLFVIPLMFREVKVKNGLRRLRIELLLLGIIIVVINMTTMYYLLLIILHDIPQRNVNVYLQLQNAFSHFLIALLLYGIYHNQYSPKNIKRHEKIDRAEKREAKIDKQ